MSQPNQNDDHEVKPTKQASEVLLGDRIWHDGDIRAVTHTQTLPEGWVLIVLDNGDTQRYRPDWTLPIATHDEMTEREQAERRLIVADTLRKIADLIVKQRIPMPRWGMRMHWMVPSSTSVRDVAQRLGWNLDEPRPDHHHVSVEQQFGESPSVSVYMHAQEAPAEPSSVEDDAPRGTDEAEEHVPPPADVEGHTHERGKPAWTAATGEHATVDRHNPEAGA